MLSAAEKEFETRGFHGGRLFDLSGAKLLLYPKQLIGTPNYDENEKGKVFCIGTPIYKKKSYKESLRLLLEDFLSESLRLEELFGVFVLLFDCGGSLTVLTDKSALYKLFTDEKQSFISSSFLAAAACTDHTLDEDSVIEQTLYGYVGAPHTLVKEVSVLSRTGKGWPGWISRIENRENGSYSSDRETEDAARQASKIAGYMDAARALAEEYGCECGLSGGCDSRLVYTAVNRKCVHMRSVHTHATSKIHEKEIRVVRKLTELYQVPLRIVPTTALLDLPPDEMDRTLRENVLYFDARNSEAIGAASQTHTREYKKAVSNGALLTFSGIGGEIYRNFYYSCSRPTRMAKWLESRAFLPFSAHTVPKDDYLRCVNRMTAKIKDQIGTDSDWMNAKLLGKRYYDSYRIQNSLTNVIHANNQMSFYLAPFTEAALIRSARTGVRWHDHCGDYEGKIIMRFDAEAAQLTTSKGYCISPLPKNIKLKWRMRSMYPSAIWIAKNSSKAPDAAATEKMRRALEKTAYLSGAFQHFQRRFPNWDYSYFLSGRMPLNSMLFTICAVYEIEKL